MNKIMIGLLGMLMFVGISAGTSHAKAASVALSAKAQQSSVQTFTGKVTRNPNNRDSKQFVLYDQNTKLNYFLDRNAIGRKYNDEMVQITGAVDKNDAIHVQSVQQIG